MPVAKIKHWGRKALRRIVPYLDLLGYVVIGVVLGIIINLLQVPFKEKPADWKAVFNIVANPPALVVCILTTIVGLMHQLRKESEERWRKYFKGAEVVIQLIPKMKPLNKVAIEVAQGIFLRNSGITGDNASRLYAIDWNTPDYWLRNDMLGYLAAQAQWQTKGNGLREVHRLFIWDRIDNIGEKILGIHCLMGFHTYVALRKSIDIAGNVERDLMRDVLYWDGTAEATPIIVQDVAAHLPGGRMVGYESPLTVQDRAALEDDNDSSEITECMRGIDVGRMLSYHKVMQRLMQSCCHFEGNYFSKPAHSITTFHTRLQNLRS